MVKMVNFKYHGRQIIQTIYFYFVAYYEFGAKFKIKNDTKNSKFVFEIEKIMQKTWNLKFGGKIKNNNNKWSISNFCGSNIV